MTPKFIDADMRVAEIYALLSSAKKLKVGCIITKDDRIISRGYNGTPPGWSNECETILPDGSLKTKPEVMHAEFNAISKLARSHESGLSASLFVTETPCLECAKLIFNAGIKEVFYKGEYKQNGLNFLLEVNIPIYKVDKVNETYIASRVLLADRVFMK